jgi:Ca2+-binding RTX toxin-like protein
MSGSVNNIVALPRTITIALPEQFELGNAIFATETWRVEWGNGAENVFTAPGPGTATTTYALLAGGGIVYQYQAAITMTAETGESLRARFDVAVFDTIWQPVSVAGRGLPDIMRGGREADTLDGGGGADTLEASWMGAATLRLGKDEDADVVLFHLAPTFLPSYTDKTCRADAPDRIVDFNPAHDVIHVESRTWRDVSLVIGTWPERPDGAAVIYDRGTGRLFLHNGDGPGAIHVASIAGRPDLTAENVVIA